MKPAWRRRWRRRHTGSAALVLAAGLLAVGINLPFGSRFLAPGAAARVARLPVAAPFRPGQRVLILAPHPDDETLCCAGVIQQARATGAAVYIAWATNGDGFELDSTVLFRRLDPTDAQMLQLGFQRVQEARRAAAVLGVPPDHLTFLGYPDGGLLHLFLEHYAAPYTSPYTGRARVYLPAAQSPGQAFTGVNLERDVERVIERVRPDLVLAPAPQDQHPDHRTLGYVALRLLAERGEVGKLRSYVVHGGLEWPLPKGQHPDLPLTVPPRAPDLAWQRVDLSPAQVRVKGEAVRAHASQTRLLNRFMTAFERRNELLAEGALPARPLGVGGVLGP